MKKYTVMAMQDTLNKMKSEPEYRVQKINGQWIVGPMKWVIFIFGPNHQAKDLMQLESEEFKNMNIVILLVTNNKQTHRNEVMNSGQV